MKSFKRVTPSCIINCWPTTASFITVTTTDAAMYVTASVHRQCVCSTIFLHCSFLHQWIFWRQLGLLSKFIDLLLFWNNFVNNKPIWIIFGTQNPEKKFHISLFFNLSTTPEKCCHCTLWNTENIIFCSSSSNWTRCTAWILVPEN